LLIQKTIEEIFHNKFFQWQLKIKKNGKYDEKYCFGFGFGLWCLTPLLTIF
jgi:hypothetical protein